MKYAPYSFSKIHTFFNCQKKFEFTYVNKIPIDIGYSDPVYFKRGRFLHSYIADRLKGGDGTKLKQYNINITDKLHLVDCADKTLENEYINISYNFNKTAIESRISLNNELKPLKLKEKILIGGFVDYYAVQDDFAMIIDWKTGKYRDNQRYAQLELYAVWLLQRYPEITEMDLVFYFVEHNKFIIKSVTVNDINVFKKDLSEKIEIIESTNEFYTNESKQCNDCPFLNTCIELYDINTL